MILTIILNWWNRIWILFFYAYIIINGWDTYIYNIFIWLSILVNIVKVEVVNCMERFSLVNDLHSRKEIIMLQPQQWNTFYFRGIFRTQVYKYKILPKPYILTQTQFSFGVEKVQLQVSCRRLRPPTILTTYSGYGK